MKTPLQRYWFIEDAQHPYSRSGIGVTAISKEDARQLVAEALSSSGTKWGSWTPDAAHSADVLENIDIRLLDQDHLIPNMGVVTDRGLWWPRL